MDGFLTSEEHIDLELLIDYVDGILDPKMNARISTHLEKCQECSRMVNGIRHYFDTFGKDRERLENYLKTTKIDILTALDETIGQRTLEARKVRSSWYYLPRIAAAAVLIFVPVLIFNYQTKSADSLVEEYISIPYHTPTTMRGDFDENMKLWNKVAFQYENNDYRGAIISLESIIRQKETLSMAHFYSGLCYLYLENPKPNKAILHLQEVVAQENPFNEQALWYLGLAYFQNSEEELATKTLERIKSYKEEEVQTLLGKLK